MQRRRPLRRQADLKARLWSRLKTLERAQFRKDAPFKTFILAFVDHEALLVVDLRGGEPGHSHQPYSVRDRLLAEAGYTVLRIWVKEAERDLDAAMRQIRAVLEDRGVFRDRDEPDSD